MSANKNISLAAQRKEAALKCVRESLAIADTLYRADSLRYKVLYPWINSSVKQKRSPALVLQTLKRLQEKEASEKKAIDVAQYLGGTLRKLEQERDTKRLRKGGAMQSVKAMDVLANIVRRAGYKVEKSGDDEPDDAA